VVDLADIALGSSGPTLGYSGNTLSGVLTVSDGSHVATLNMIGNYVLGSFKTNTDGHGGTLLTDPPVSSGSTLAAGH
jgi:hypothetical protein